MACVAVRSFMSLVSASRVDDLVIIVGKGTRSTERATLLPVVRDLLVQEYGIEAKLDPDNSGRIVVDAGCLRAFVSGRSWT